jgi:hypothetical protein
MRVVTLPLPLETPTKVGVLNRQRCKKGLSEQKMKEIYYTPMLAAFPVLFL